MDGKWTDTTKHDHATDYKDTPGHPELQHLVVRRQNKNNDDHVDNNKKINKT